MKCTSTFKIANKALLLLLSMSLSEWWQWYKCGWRSQSHPCTLIFATWPIDRLNQIVPLKNVFCERWRQLYNHKNKVRHFSLR